MTNLGLELALKNHGIAFSRAKVGDRYVSELMEKIIGFWVGSHQDISFVQM